MKLSNLGSCKRFTGRGSDFIFTRNLFRNPEIQAAKPLSHYRRLNLPSKPFVVIREIRVKPYPLMPSKRTKSD